ncbi:GAF and ANTAR domain-containing protein [Plantactinospora soyae]|uniref:Transcriptional regulator with GAF, ATPase, and Fis domain n=1 Tax=Plantactinospora soyae TaxID=1544732 RepID=A0A927R9K1_9ACTN|nr:GAF and ANTAR domain-containing protein [Plantactinospora soyae]MBE1491519.1 transcriptional regulator with GAF, ATPase, and Fis domain [Plantactinospora soyae]
MSERQLTEAFVELADTLVDDFDMMDFLHQVTVRCAQVLDVSAAGVLLTDQRGELRVVAASTEQTRLLELLQLQTDEGPCPECFHTGRPVAVADLSTTAHRWPRFTAEARRSGFASVHALPMRLRTEVIGALNLFGAEPGALDADTIRLGQALADVATIGLLQARAIRHRETLAEQLQTALNSRIVIEQAKGVVAERRKIDVDQSFILLRGTARTSNRRLSELARAVVDGSAIV